MEDGLESFTRQLSHTIRLSLAYLKRLVLAQTATDPLRYFTFACCKSSRFSLHAYIWNKWHSTDLREVQKGSIYH